MESQQAISALGALAQETRLAAFRLLMVAGPKGLPAGVIAERLKVATSTLSFHLTDLNRSGLVVARRESRSIIYSVDFEGMRRLLDFLTEDCCKGNPQLCGLPSGRPKASRARASKVAAPADV